MAQLTGLTIRQHARASLDLRIEFVVAERVRDQVRFSPMSNAIEPHVTRGIAQDVSQGGMGIVCPQFVPRMCDGIIRVYNPKPVGKSQDGSPIHEVIFEHPVKVRRVTLESHDPSYAMGLAFVDPTPDLAERVNELLALVEEAAEDGQHG